METVSNACVGGSGSPVLIHQRFVWPYGGRSVYLTGSFTRWTDHVAMAPVEGCPTVFQTVCSLTPGYHEYKFFVDGELRHDGSKPCASRSYGIVNTIIIAGPDCTQGNGSATESGMDLDTEAFRRVVRVSDGTYQPVLHSLPSTDIEISRHCVSEYLSTHAVYDMVPDSGKVIALDFDLPVKQAFHILYEQGIPLAPLWDSSKGHFVGVLSPSDFILMLKELRSSWSTMSNEEMEMHTISAWKGGKIDLDGQMGRLCRDASRGLIHLGPYHSLKDLALKILQNEVSSVPIILSSVEDGSCHQLLNIASLSEVLRCICRYFRNSLAAVPIFQVPVCSLPMGSWVPSGGEDNRRPLAVLRACDPLSSALNLLLQAQVSAIPVVDDSGSLLDIYSRSDITALAKDRVYEEINVDELTVDQVLKFTHNAYNGQQELNRYQMCLRTDPLFKVMEYLAKPGVRRIIVVEPGSKRVQGIISLSDILKLFLC